MATIVTRAGKGSPLTHNEVDANFTNLNTAKAELASPALTGNVTVASNSATAAVTITQIGAGNALVVEDSASPDASPFVVTAVGNVGIGTTAPAFTLEAAGVTRSIAATGTGNPQLLAITSDAAGIPFVTLQNATASWQNRNNGTTGDLSWSVSGSERMRITLGGNVGIGVTPSAWVSTSKAVQLPGISLESTAATSGNIFANAYRDSSFVRRYVNTGTANQFDMSSAGFRWFNAPSGTAGDAVTFTQHMTLDASGNLGIGTTSPSASLDVLTQVTGALGISLRGRSSDNVSDFSLKSNDAATVYGQIQGRSTDLRLQTGTALPITFFTNSAERMRINASGNVGIGVTPSAWSWGGRVIDGTNNMVISAGGNNLILAANIYWNGTAWTYKTTSEASYYSQNAAVHQWFTAPSGTAGTTPTFTERMRIDSTGAIGIGGANYGTSGQTIVSAGSAAAPAWGYPTQLSTATGSAPSYACRAWVNFNGTGTVAIRASGNVTSITDNGTGQYTVNFTTAMQDGNYAWSGSTRDAGTATGNTGALVEGSGSVAQTAAALPVWTKRATTIQDMDVVAITIFR